MNHQTNAPAPPRDNRAFLAGLLLITLACFWPVGGFGFIGYDDYDYVYQNTRVRSGLNFDNIIWAFTAPAAGNWHPLTWLSLMLDCEVFGLDPHEEHWVNAAFHTANVLLLFLFLRQITGARWRSFFVAALFACHPLHVQSVAWISERKDVLSGFFGILTLMAYARYCRSKTSADYALTVVLFSLGLMAKPMLVTLPVMLCLLDFWPLQRVSSFPSFKIVLWEKIPFIALGIVSSVVTLWAQKSGGAVASMQAVPVSSRCLHTAVAYVLYLGKLLWPVNLAIFYPFPREKPEALVWLGALLLLGTLTLIAFWRKQTQPYLLVGWLWFLVMLVPVIGLVQVGSQSMADRYMYLPSIGLFLIAAWGTAEMARTLSGKRCLAGVGSILVVACLVDSRHQLGFWRDNITLFQHVVDVSPENNYLGYFYLGISFAELGNLPAAEHSLNLSLKAAPGFEMAEERLGNVMLVEKKFAGAEIHLRRFTHTHPQDVPTRVALGLALAGQQKYIDAQAEFQAIEQFMPDNEAINRLVLDNEPKAEASSTLAILLNQLKTNATPEIHIRIALTEDQLGNYPETVRHYENALSVDANSVEALNNLAWMLATCPDPSVRNGPRAVQLAERSCELTKFKVTIFLGTLAAAQAEAGEFDKAVTTAQRACANAETHEETDLLKSNEYLLGLYRSHQTYHKAGE